MIHLGELTFFISGVVLLSALLSIVLRTKICDSAQMCSSVLVRNISTKLKHVLTQALDFKIFSPILSPIWNRSNAQHHNPPNPRSGFTQYSPQPRKRKSLWQETLRLPVRSSLFLYNYIFNSNLRVLFAVYLLSIPVLLAMRATLSWESRWLDELTRTGISSILLLCLLLQLAPTRDSQLFDYLEW